MGGHRSVQSLHEPFVHSGLCGSYLSFGNQKIDSAANKPTLPLPPWKLFHSLPKRLCSLLNPDLILEC